MTDAAIQSISLVVIALFSMIGGSISAYFSFRSVQATKANAAGIVHLTGTVEDIKKQTDGLTSALVQKTEEKSRMQVDAATLAARETERLRGEETAATLERGRRAGMEAAVQQAVGPSALAPAAVPIPVTDAAANRVAAATEKLAKAAEETVIAAKKDT